MVSPLASVGGLLSLTGIIGASGAATAGNNTGEIITLIGAIGGLLASVAALIAAFRRRDPQIIIVRSREEAEEIEKNPPAAKRTLGAHRRKR